MEANRIIHMYGDKASFYPVSMYVFFFGIGWLCAKYGEMGFGYIFPYALALYLAIHITDALIKSAFFIKDHFKFTLTLRE